MSKGIFGGLFDSAFSSVSSKFAGNLNSDIEMQLLTEMELTKLYDHVSQLKPFAKKADESYRLLIYEKLTSVPAVDLYDGEYTEQLDKILSKASHARTPEQVIVYEEQIIPIATQIQTYLNEETSSLEAAKLWDSKYIKGVQDHIPPHWTKENMEFDDTMSLVMEAFRNWSSFAQASIDMYGSQRLINATYEAVEDGQDALEYMNEILDLNNRNNSGFGKGLHEDVIVPYAGFFGSGFFF